MENMEQNTMDNSLRSVFVGNIPYDVTEEKLREIFSEVGTILSFKLMYDRETGKPKGYGFCEYRDQETALSAMRNLNGYEISGRTIRVDSACTEKSRMEMQSLMQTQVVENPYGPPCDPEKAPEIISQMVASMSPEALFDLVKQMKISIQNNPDETKAMLTSNPQISYAILQALVVLKLIDVDSACSMLHKKNAVPPVLQPIDPIQQMARQMIPPSPLVTGPQNMSTPLHLLPPMHQIQPVPKPDFPFPAGNQRPVDQDLRITRDVNLMTQSAVLSMANINTPPPSIASTITQPPPPSLTQNDVFNRDQRNQDPRTRVIPDRQVSSVVSAPQTIPVPKPPPIVKQEQESPTLTPEAPTTSSNSGPSSDEEKAALIMQVLQLTDEQITMLPIDQRKSILALREQIAKSTNYNNP